MSNSHKGSCSRSSSVRSKHSARVVAQTTMDAKLHADFEESEKLFDYSRLADVNALNAASCSISSSAVRSYLQRMQRGQLIQPFGCMIAVNEQTFAILAYSENVPEMLDFAPHAVPSIDQKDVIAIGMDVRVLFSSATASALHKAANIGELNTLNPLLVHCRSSGKPFYAILHRIDIGLVIDLEPVNPADMPSTAAGALKSYKLAAKAISRLQVLPSGNIGLLCDVLVREVSELTGYDRVMAYKFHEDEHGEVIAECKRPDLESYLGLHYPATDIPQASRFLFIKNKVRMICDCTAAPVKVIQNEKLEQPLSLCGSTLRFPHGCHVQYMTNMGSIASLVMSVVINESDEATANDQPEAAATSEQPQKGRKLWGLVVCHHRKPRFIPYPLRYACEFLIQVFSVQLNKEVELAIQVREKHILRTQTVLCDMLLRDAPVGIVTQSPNIMDLVKCNGAALYYGKQFWLLGTTPTEAQIRDIIAWLHESHGSSTGLSTDSLMEAGYPRALVLGNAVCGMAAVKITSRDFLFWFRSHTAKEIKWGGAKHVRVDKDDGKRMHPRSSFKAFLEVIKWRSLPWEDVEMDAIHSLQLILRGSLQEVAENNPKDLSVQPDVVKAEVEDELRIVANEMVRLIETASVPILAVDSSGKLNGWNMKTAELTGLSVEHAIGLPLIDLVDEGSIQTVNNMIFLALEGKEEKNLEIKLKTYGNSENNTPVILVVNACSSRDVNQNVVGVCFVGQDLTSQKILMDKFTRIQGDYVSIIQNPSPLIPPIFMMDMFGCCCEWNSAMENLSGLKRKAVIGKVLIGEVFCINDTSCNVKDYDTLTKLRIVLNSVMAGEDGDKLFFGFFDQKGKYIEALLSTNKRVDAQGRITGVLCFLRVACPELQCALQLQRVSERTASSKLKELSYMRQELRNPLNGIMFTYTLMEGSSLSKEQNQLLRSSTLCQQQVSKILDDMDLESIEECYLELNTAEFNLGDSLEAILSQCMILSRERQVQIIRDWSSEISSLYLYGDNMRLQQTLVNFLITAFQFTHSSNRPVTLKVASRKRNIGTDVHVIHLDFRIVHSAPGVPEALIREMFHQTQEISREGLGLYISQKLVKIMNGTVQYLREAERSSFIVLLEFPLAHHHGKAKVNA